MSEKSGDASAFLESSTRWVRTDFPRTKTVRHDLAALPDKLNLGKE
jgi:hypothetical protein